MGKHSKDRRDVYYRAAKQVGYRARSAYKLLQLDRHFHLLHGVSRVIDLCAAPGGWSEVLSAKLCPPPASSSSSSSCSSPPPSALSSTPPLLIAVDLAPMAPIPGVRLLQADLTLPSTVQSLLALLGDGLAELVLCDAAPDVVHQADLDELVQQQLTRSALQLCTQLLCRGGVFVCKVFRGSEVRSVLRDCARLFDDVVVAKPRASRNSSMEAFLVCRGHRGSGAGHTLERALHRMGLEGEREGKEEAEAVVDEVVEEEEEEGSEGEGEWRARWRFVSCGDELGWDADQTYPLSFRLPHSASCPSSSTSLPASTRSLAPSALPIDPPYQTALRLQRLRHAQQRRQPKRPDAG